MINILSLMPDNDVRKVVCFCLDTLNLSLEETQSVLYDASRVTTAMNTLLNGRVISTRRPEVSPDGVT